MTMRAKLIEAAHYVSAHRPDLFVLALAARIAQSGDESHVELFRQPLRDTGEALFAEADALKAEGKRPLLRLV